MFKGSAVDEANLREFVADFFAGSLPSTHSLTSRLPAAAPRLCCSSAPVTGPLPSDCPAASALLLARCLTPPSPSLFRDVVSGKLVPDLKSEDIPESQDGPVTVLVGKVIGLACNFIAIS